MQRKNKWEHQRGKFGSNVVRLRPDLERVEETLYELEGFQDDEEELKDPIADERLKMIVANFYGNGVRSTFGKTEIRNNPNKGPHGWQGKNKHYEIWADRLPIHMQRQYGICSPVGMVRAQRPLDNFTFMFFQNHRAIRYMHIAICAWANRLPLTTEMHRKLVGGWYQDGYNEMMGLVVPAGLIELKTEDWTEKKVFHSMSTQGQHIRPTRRAIYHSIDSIVFLLNALRGQYEDAAYFFRDYEGQSWVSEDTPMPLNGVTGERNDWT